MRIIFMGNPAFAIPSLNAILESSHEVVAVISNPEKRMGRGKTLSHTPVGQFAIEKGLNLIQANLLKDHEEVYRHNCRLSWLPPGTSESTLATTPP